MILSKKQLKIVVGITILLLLGYSLLLVSKSRTFQFFGVLIDHIDTDEKLVALTFDDAPTEYVDGVLEVLKEKGVKATFYVVGQASEQYPEFLSAILEGGHDVGNHSYSHQRFLLKTPSFIEHEIETTHQILRDAGYLGEITFRPPHGKKLFGLPWYLSQHDIVTIMWDVEPDTFVHNDAKAITKYTLDNVKAGSIILMHPFCGTACEADRQALPQIIDTLVAEGYSFVTISELLKYVKY